jgi:hypothetical protein
MISTVIGVVVVAALLVGLFVIAKRFLKPPAGELPDCCKGGNKDINLRR